MFAGIEESEDDRKVIDDICFALKVKPDPKARLIGLKKGDPSAPHKSLLRVEFSSLVVRAALLSNAKYLRFHVHLKNIFIRPDLSPSQIVKNKRLIEELKSRRNAGDDVIIKSGQVILRPAVTPK